MDVVLEILESYGVVAVALVGFVAYVVRDYRRTEAQDRALEQLNNEWRTQLVELHTQTQRTLQRTNEVIESNTRALESLLRKPHA